MPDSLLLIKLAGLLRSGASIEVGLKHIGGMPKAKELRYLLQLCQLIGSAVVSELEQVASFYSAKEVALEKIKVSQAGPKASTRLMIWLPALTLGLAQISGFDLVGAFLKTPALLFSLSLGIILLAIARMLSQRLVSNSTPSGEPIGLLLIGIALAASGGAELGQAKRLALAEYKKVFESEPSAEELKALAEVELLVVDTGAKVAELLRRQAAVLQRSAIIAAELVIEKLSVKLLLPLGLVVLPAFVFIALIPLMASMLGKV